MKNDESFIQTLKCVGAFLCVKLIQCALQLTVFKLLIHMCSTYCFLWRRVDSLSGYSCFVCSSVRTLLGGIYPVSCGQYLAAEHQELPLCVSWEYTSCVRVGCGGSSGPGSTSGWQTWDPVCYGRRGQIFYVSLCCSVLELCLIIVIIIVVGDQKRCTEYVRLSEILHNYQKN